MIPGGAAPRARNQPASRRPGPAIRRRPASHPRRDPGGTTPWWPVRRSDVLAATVSPDRAPGDRDAQHLSDLLPRRGAGGAYGGLRPAVLATCSPPSRRLLSDRAGGIRRDGRPTGSVSAVFGRGPDDLGGDGGDAPGPGAGPCRAIEARHAALAARQEEALRRANAELAAANDRLSGHDAELRQAHERVLAAGREAEQAGAELRRVNRTLKALSDSNQALTRVNDESRLSSGGLPHRAAGLRLRHDLDRLRGARTRPDASGRWPRPASTTATCRP